MSSARDGHPSRIIPLALGVVAGIIDDVVVVIIIVIVFVHSGVGVVAPVKVEAPVGGSRVRVGFDLHDDGSDDLVGAERVRLDAVVAVAAFPVGRKSAVEIGPETVGEPPAGSKVRGAVAVGKQIVVSIVRAGKEKT